MYALMKTRNIPNTIFEKSVRLRKIWEKIAPHVTFIVACGLKIQANIIYMFYYLQAEIDTKNTPSGFYYSK